MSTRRPVYYRSADLPALEGIYAEASGHRFPRHSHCELVIGLVISGAKQFEIGRGNQIAGAGSVFLVPPGEVHTGRALVEGGTTYTAWFIGISHLPERMRASANCTLLPGPKTASAIVRLRRAAESGASLLTRQCCLESLIASVACSDRHRSSAVPRPISPGVRRAAEYLRECYSLPSSLDHLAALAGMSRFHFLRAFRNAHQLPPHAYLDQIRVKRAKHLLLAGQPIATVALAVGYSDQAHLTRRLKRLTALTPGQIAGRSNFVQYEIGDASYPEDAVEELQECQEYPKSRIMKQARPYGSCTELPNRSWE